MSKVREQAPLKTGELEVPPTGDLKPYEVFVQIDRNKPPAYVGGLEAADGEMALQFAREHYGRDQPCVAVWVAPRDAVLKTDPDKDVVWRLSDQSYRQAKGYLEVRKKWEKFRKKGDVDQYQKEDLKEAF